jgi:hypothetical protein
MRSIAYKALPLSADREVAIFSSATTVMADDFFAAF